MMRPLKRILLLAVVLMATVLTVAVPAAAQDEDTAMDVCYACHDTAVDAFQQSPHGQAMARHSDEMLQRSCATCHGPVEQHLEEFSAESISRVPKAENCASCHPSSAGSLGLANAAHPRFGVSCLDCHNVAHEEEMPELPEPLLRAEPSELCGSCHGGVKSAFSRPFAHREGLEKPFACTECHSAHAGGGEVRQLSILSNGGVCIRCHTEKSGPFIFPHAPREVDGCVSCHEPHGSVNPRQLVRRTVANLCLECHANVPQRSFHDFSRARNRACQTCHRAVHGSNSDPRLLEE